MFSYLRRGTSANFGELNLPGNSMVIHGQIFSMKDLKFSVEKVGDSKIKITVRKKRFVKEGAKYLGEMPTENIIKGEE